MNTHTHTSLQQKSNQKRSRATEMKNIFRCEAPHGTHLYLSHFCWQGALFCLSYACFNNLTSCIIEVLQSWKKASALIRSVPGHNNEIIIQFCFIEFYLYITKSQQQCFISEGKNPTIIQREKKNAYQLSTSLWIILLVLLSILFLLWKLQYSTLNNVLCNGIFKICLFALI